MPPKTGWEVRRDFLDTTEPWKKSELESYQERDRNFIRNIQISKGITKDAAKEVFQDYLQGSDKNKKKIRDNVRKSQKNYTQYPKSHEPQKITGEHKRRAPSKTKGKKRKAVADLTPKVRTRMLNGRKKWKDASDSEIMHGVNSKWSQNYRLRNGQGRYYEGRIVEESKK